MSASHETNSDPISTRTIATLYNQRPVAEGERLPSIHEQIDSDFVSINDAAYSAAPLARTDNYSPRNVRPHTGRNSPGLQIDIGGRNPDSYLLPYVEFNQGGPDANVLRITTGTVYQINTARNVAVALKGQQKRSVLIKANKALRAAGAIGR